MNKLKNNKGFTQIDIVISIVIVMLFVSLIAALYYNSYIASQKVKRDTESTTYLTQILQAIDFIEYEDLEDLNSGIVAKINTMDSNKLFAKTGSQVYTKEEFNTKPYIVHVNITNYGDTQVATEREDLVKIITIYIAYKNNEANPVKAERLKTKDIIFKDELSIIPNLYEEAMVPLNNNDDKQITTKYAKNWFDYSNNQVAKAVLKDAKYTLNGTIEGENDADYAENYGSRFIFIPRFAYKLTTDENENEIAQIKFLNLDNTCKDGSVININQETENIEQNKYYVPSIFTQNNIELNGIWVGEFLTRKYIDENFPTGRIYITDKNNQIWTGLSDIQKQEKIDEMIAVGNPYGLSQDIGIKIVNNDIYNAINILGESKYSFIANAVKEYETDYTGSFRIYMY